MKFQPLNAQAAATLCTTNGMSLVNPKTSGNDAELMHRIKSSPAGGERVNGIVLHLCKREEVEYFV